MISISDVFSSVNDTLRELFPKARVHKERIRRLNTPSLSVELVSFTTPQHSKHIINKKIDLDIIYFSNSNDVGEALEVCDRLMSAFSMGIYVRKYGKDRTILDKRFIHCLQAPEYKLVDQDLHFMVKFEFADELMAAYMTDRKDIKPFSQDTRGTDFDSIMDLVKQDETDPKKDKKEFVKDVDFTKEEDRKAYEDEGLKYMEKMKLNYEL